MKPTKSFTFLLLLLLLVTVHGIRLNRELISEASNRIHDTRKEERWLRSSRVHERQHRRPAHRCRSSLCSGHPKNSRPPKRSVDQGMPSLHADYYGPRIHDPRHH